jgi:hypothetical protein
MSAEGQVLLVLPTFDARRALDAAFAYRATTTNADDFVPYPLYGPYGDIFRTPSIDRGSTPAP